MAVILIVHTINTNCDPYTTRHGLLIIPASVPITGLLFNIPVFGSSRFTFYAKSCTLQGLPVL